MSEESALRRGAAARAGDAGVVFVNNGGDDVHPSQVAIKVNPETRTVDFQVI